MKKLTAFLGVLAGVAIAPLAHASLTISYQVDGGAIVQCAVGIDTLAVCSPSITDGVVTISALAGHSNSPGGISADQSGSTVDVSSTAAARVTFWFSAQNFTAPTTPPNIKWLANLQFTSFSPSGTGSITSQNCVDAANGNTPGGPVGQKGFCTAPAGILNNSVLPITGPGTPPTDTVTSSIANLASPYALQQKVTLVFNDAGSVNFITSQLLTSVPEPMSIALLGGILLVTTAALRRKRHPASPVK